MLIKRQMSLNTVLVPKRKVHAGPLRRLQQQGAAHEQWRSEESLVRAVGGGAGQ